MKLEFRKLRADEIDIRAATCTERGASLLLYKDARCDMNILDETVTPMGWMRQHSRDNANCTVSIWDEDKSMWISKEDVGTESNTEAEKGLASDSFKRACFNWGIGRELYTAPAIWVDAGTVRIEQNYKGKFEIKDKLHVSDIQYDSNSIVSLEIKTGKGVTVFAWTKNGVTKTPAAQTKKETPVQPKQEPHKQPAVNDDAVCCSLCKKPITDFLYDEGKKKYSARTIIGRAKEQFGKCMCYECLQKAVNDDAPRTEYDERAMQEIA